PDPRELQGSTQPHVQREGGVGPDRQIRADGEVREAQQPPGQRERDGGQGENAAGHDAVEDVLRDGRHSGRQGLMTVTRSFLPFRTCWTMNGAERMSPIWSKSQAPEAPS